MRWRIIWLVTFLAGLFYLLEYVLPTRVNPLTPLRADVGVFLLVVASFNLLLGWGMLVSKHAKTLWRREAGWVNSVGFLGSLVAMLVVGFWHDWPQATPPEWVEGAFQLLYYHIFMPLVATVFSLLAFFMVSAAFRAFKMRTAEASLLMLSAFVVMIGQVPVGQWLAAQSPLLAFPQATVFILGVVTAAVVRALIFGVVIGALAMALRLWLGLERGAFFERRA